MSELNARIAAWRETLALRLSNAELDELEDHLRQTVEGLSETPLTLDERFVVATGRLGAAAAIAREFEKGDPARVWRRRIFWMLAGSVGFGLFDGLVDASTQGLTLAAWTLGASPQVAVYAAFSFQVAAWILIAAELVALTRGNGRAAQACAAWLTRLPIIAKAALAAATALVLFGLPEELMKLLSVWTMPMAEFSSHLQALAIGGLALRAIGVAGLVIALALAARGRRPVVPAVESAG